MRTLLLLFCLAGSAASYGQQLEPEKAVSNSVQTNGIRLKLQCTSQGFHLAAQAMSVTNHGRRLYTTIGRFPGAIEMIGPDGKPVPLLIPKVNDPQTYKERLGYEEIMSSRPRQHFWVDLKTNEVNYSQLFPWRNYFNVTNAGEHELRLKARLYLTPRPQADGVTVEPWWPRIDFPEVRVRFRLTEEDARNARTEPRRQ